MCVDCAAHRRLGTFVVPVGKRVVVLVFSGQEPGGPPAESEGTSQSAVGVAVRPSPSGAAIRMPYSNVTGGRLFSLSQETYNGSNSETDWLLRLGPTAATPKR